MANAENRDSNKYKFFDPESPEPPEEIFGVPTKSLVDLGEAASSLLVATPYWPGKPTGIYSLSDKGKHALAIFPLIERVQAGETITPEDVRPYRKPIKKVVPRLGTIDKLLATSSVLGVGIPARRALNRKIERDFASRVPEVIALTGDHAEAYLPQVESEIDFLSQFENPRQEFVSEIGVVTGAIRKTAQERAQQRRQSEVTAADAGYGISHELGYLILNKADARQSLPLVSHFVLERLPSDVKLPEEKIVSVTAPELMSMLEAALPKDQRDPRFMASIQRHPHPMRGMASMFKGSELRWLRDGVLLLPSIRDLLPTTGQEAKERFNRIRYFLTSTAPKQNT